MTNPIAQVQALINSGQLMAGMQLLLDLIKKNPHDQEVLQLIIALSNYLPDKKQSIALLNQCIAIGANSPLLQYELGSTALGLGSHEEAIHIFEKILEKDPHHFESLHDLGAAYGLLGDKTNALKYLLEASAINDQSADLQYNLGRLNDELFKHDIAIKHYQKAIELDPMHTQSWINLGIDLSAFKKYAESLKCFEQAFSQNPNIDFLFGDCVYTRLRMCQWDGIEKIKDQLQNAIENGACAISPFPLSALIDLPTLQFQAAKLYANAKYPENQTLGPISETHNKKIRIGYFSPDFHEHPASYLMAEVFELHNRERFEIFAFSFGKNSNDPMRKRLEKSFDHFIDICNQTPQEICSLSRKLQIDIAVDLCGYTENARTEIFALKAAPIQISYIGFLGTMGANYMNYLIADRTIVPPSTRDCYTEKVIYLPSYQANDSKRVAGDKTFTKDDFGIKKDQFVFCNLNNLFKITEEIFFSWLNILNKIPNSVMMLYGENLYGIDNLKQYAIKKNFNPDRLIFVERVSREDYLARYKVVDLFLDTTPYNAGTTASDALWMDVPVITIQGKSFTSRVASSLLTHLNLPELIHQSIQTYEAQAIEFGTNPSKLSSIKEKLIKNKIYAPLFNSSLFVNNLEKAFSEAQSNYQNGLPPKDIFIQ